MLKAASLPPSMAKREKTHRKPCICPRTYKDLGIKCDTHSTKSKNHFQTLEQEFDELRREFLSSNSPRPHKIKKWGEKRVLFWPNM